MTKWYWSFVGVVSCAIVLAQPPASEDSNQAQNVTSNSPASESPTVIVTDFKEVRMISSQLGIPTGTSFKLVIPDFDDLDQVKDVQCSFTSAIDETGRKLVKTEKDLFGQSEFIPDEVGGNLEIEVKLKNAARRATFISLEGTLDLFIPTADPESTITVVNVKTTAGMPIQSDILKGMNVSVMLVPPMKTEEAESPVETETHNANDEPGEKGAGAALAQGLEDAFSKMFGGGSPNSVTLEIVDPENKIQGIEFFSQSGEKISSNGTYMSRGGGEKLSKTLDFVEPLPETAEMRISVWTQKSQRKIPFRLPKIPLP